MQSHTELPANDECPASVTSRDTEADSKTCSQYTVTSVPAAALVSCDIEAGSESFSDTVTEVPSSTTTSDDVETSIKTSTVTSVPAEVVTSRDREAGSQAPGAAVTSRDQEAGIKSTSAGSESPGRYVRKKTSAASYAASPLKLTPQSNRRVFPRTNPTYVAAHSSSVDGVSRSSSLRSTDTGLSVESASHDADLSHELSAVSEISSPMRHVRHTSDPFSLNMPVADAVSMETRATTDQSSDQQTTSVSSALPRQFTAGSTSLPSTPQQVKLHISRIALASADVSFSCHRFIVCGRLYVVNIHVAFAVLQTRKSIVGSV